MIDCLLLPLLNRCPVQGQTVTRQTCSVTAVPVSRIPTRCVGMGCFCISALMLSVKLSPQTSSSVSYLHAGHRFDPLAATSRICPLSEDERFLRCIFRSMRLSDNSLELRLDDRQHTFNPRPFFLNSLVRRIGFVLDRFNTDLNGSLVELRQLLHHEFESVKTFPSGEHSCCICKRIVVPFARVLPSRCSAPRCDFCPRDSVLSQMFASYKRAGLLQVVDDAPAERIRS